MINSVNSQKKNICILYKMNYKKTTIQFLLDDTKNANTKVFNKYRNKITGNRVRVKFGSNLHFKALQDKKEIKYKDKYRRYEAGKYDDNLIKDLNDTLPTSVVKQNKDPAYDIKNAIVIDLKYDDLEEWNDWYEDESSNLIVGKKRVFYTPTYKETDTHQFHKDNFSAGNNDDFYKPPDYDYTKLIALEDGSYIDSETFGNQMGIYKNLREDFEGKRIILKTKYYSYKIHYDEKKKKTTVKDHYKTIVVESEIKMNGEPIEIKTQLVKHFEKVAFKSEDSSEWFKIILSTEVLGFDLADEAGCSTREKRGGFNGMFICNPKSSGNNCIISCFMKGLKRKSNKNTSINIRKYIDENGDKEIPIVKIDNICNYFYDLECLKIKVNVYEIGQDLPCFIYGDLEKYDIELNFLKIENHMSLIEKLDYNSKKCEVCGVWYKDKHKCNNKTISFYQSCIDKSKGRLDGSAPKVMISKSYKKKDKFTGDKAIIYDIETFSNPHIPYAIGWFNTNSKKYYVSYGKDCYREFIDYLLTIDGYNIVAFNGANFDNHFSLKFLLNEYNKKVSVKDIIINNGSIMKYAIEWSKTGEEYEKEKIEVDKHNTELKDKFFLENPKYKFGVCGNCGKECPNYCYCMSCYKDPDIEKNYEDKKLSEELKRTLKRVNKKSHYFSDLALFIPNTSLKDALDGYGCKVQKGEFDHDKIKSWLDVETHKEESLIYLEKDVKGLAELYKKFGDGIQESFKEVGNFNIDKFLTISQVAYEIWSTTVVEEIYIPNIIENEFIDKSVYGGRTHPVKRFYESTQYQEVKNKVEEINNQFKGKNKTCEINNKKKELTAVYKSIKDYIWVADVKSLYPTSMDWYKYPTGKSRWIENGKECEDHKGLGIYEIDYITNKKLPISILPRRNEKGGGCIWDLKDGSGTYTSVDIQNAIDMGYEINYKRGLVWNTSAKVFSEYVNMVYKLKLDAEKEENEIQRSVAKLLLNALYGKTIQKAIFSNTTVINNNYEASKFFKDYNWTDFIDLGGKCLMTGERVDKVNGITKPIQLGAFVLGYSRKIMLDYTDKIVPTLKSDLKMSMLDMWYYTDTDCLHIKSSQLENIKDDMGDTLGCMDNDIKNGGIVIKSYYLAPKLYACEYIDKSGNIKFKLRGKGVPNSLLGFQQYKDLYENEQGTTVSFESAFKKCKFSSQLIKNGENSKNVSAKKLEFLDIFKESMTRTIGKSLWKGRKYMDKINTIPHYAEFN